MKIGLSFSRCVRDIVEGRVDISDVLVIIARTDFDPRIDDQWAGIWRGYAGGSNRGSMIRMLSGSNPEWHGYGDEDEELFRGVSIELWDQGKIHQPRKFGAHVRRLPYYWMEAIPDQDEMTGHPAVLDAWQQFKTVAGLAGAKLNHD